MINQKLIAEVEALKAQQIKAIENGVNSLSYVGQMYGLTRMALLSDMTEEWQWLSEQLSELRELKAKAAV